MMKQRKFFSAALLSCLILLGGCSRPASDHPIDNADPAPFDEEETISSANDPDSDTVKNDTEDQDDEPDASESETQTEEPSKNTGDPSDNTLQGCYQIFDSGFEITVQEPFVIYYDPLSLNMTVTSQADPTFRGYIFYDTSDYGMDQLENAVKNLEPSVELDPTIKNLTTDVDEQEDGLFSFTFTYSAGATDGSPAGFYFTHYQKTKAGIINVNLFTERSSSSKDILKLIDTIQAATDNAAPFGE